MSKRQILCRRCNDGASLCVYERFPTYVENILCYNIWHEAVPIVMFSNQLKHLNAIL